jgi:hypothetical protein
VRRTVIDLHTGEIIEVLDDPPAGELAALRGLLLEEHVWRVREGLGQRRDNGSGSSVVGERTRDLSLGDRRIEEAQVGEA